MFSLPRNHLRAFSSVQFIRVSMKHGRHGKWMVFIVMSFFVHYFAFWFFYLKVVELKFFPLSL